jgi:hypothetical protein
MTLAVRRERVVLVGRQVLPPQVERQPVSVQGERQ